MSPASAPIVIGPFALDTELGRGGMGVVWRAVHIEQGVPVALKVLTSAAARDPGFVMAVQTEVHATARLGHPGIVLLLDAGVVAPETAEASGGALIAGSPWLAMELLDGGTLDPRRTVQSWEETRDLLFLLLGALGHAHARGVTHRDLKCGNILFAGPGSDAPGPRLVDFGLALERADRVDPTRTAAAQELVDDMGSVHTMAPEQRTASSADQGPWTDLYALGCIAWEIVCGERPFPGLDLFSVTWAHLDGRIRPFAPRFAVPHGVEGWLRRLLARSPRDRFQSAADAALFLRGLERGVGSGLGVLAALPADWRALERPRRSGRLLGAGLGLFGLRPPPLVGREDARDALWGALRAAVATKTPRCALLHGVPGVGASRLAQWLAETAEECAGARVLTAGPLSGAGARGGVGAMVARALRCEGLEGEDLALRVEAEVRALGGVDPYEWRGLTAIVAADGALQAPVGLPQVRASERGGLLRRLLARLAASKPVVLVLSDLHVAPDAVVLLEQILAAPPRSLGPVVVVATLRSDSLQQRAGLREWLAGQRAEHELTEIVCEPLDATLMRTLVDGMLPLHGALSSALVARADGNPQFAVQLLGEQIRRGLLVAGEEGYALAGDELVLPEDARSLWLLRLQTALADLPSDAVRAVEIAAALGAPVPRAIWRAACRHGGVVDATSDDVEQRLLSSGLARADEAGWSFGHGMLEECCVEEAQRTGRWVGACAGAGEALLATGTPADEERAGLLLLAGERWERGIALVLEAAWRRGRASEFGQMGALLDRVEDALMSSGGAPDAPQRGRGLVLRARHAQMLGDLDGCEAGLHELLSVQAPGWALLHAEATAILGSVARLRSRWDEARLLLEEALDGVRGGPPLLRATTVHELAMIERRTGRSDAAAQRYGEAAEAYLEADDRLGAARCEQGLGFIANDRGDHVEARRIFEALLPTLEELGDRIALAATIDGLAAARMGAGDLVEAGAGHLRAWTMMEETGSPAAFISALNYVLVLLMQRDFAEADLVLAAIADAVAQPAFLGWRSQVLVARLACDAARRDWASWEVHLREATEALQTRPASPTDVGAAAEIAARRAHESGEPARAIQALELARAMCRLTGDDERLASLDRALVTAH